MKKYHYISPVQKAEIGNIINIKKVLGAHNFIPGYKKDFIEKYNINKKIYYSTAYLHKEKHFLNKDTNLVIIDKKEIKLYKIEHKNYTSIKNKKTVAETHIIMKLLYKNKILYISTKAISALCLYSII